ncbi:hypothetical protein CG709_07300, partial [Lachnotalea glycerini]
MKKKARRALTLALSCITAFMLAACGSSNSNEVTANVSGNSTNGTGTFTMKSDSPYAEKGYDLSQQKTIAKHEEGEEPTEMQKERDRPLKHTPEN